VEEKKQDYVLPKLKISIFVTSFDLWMFKGACDIFVIVINFVGSNWQPKQVTISLFEIIKIIDQTLANKLIELFDQYGLKRKIIVINEGSNLNTISKILGLDESFQGICFGHIFSRCVNMLLLTKRYAIF
jgi:hypothetical protein